MAASKRIRFSKRSVDALKAKRKRYFVYDVTTANLCVCVSPVDIRTFYRYGRIDGRPVRYRLGAYPEMSVQQARPAQSDVVRLHGKAGTAMSTAPTPNRTNRCCIRGHTR